MSSRNVTTNENRSDQLMGAHMKREVMTGGTKEPTMATNQNVNAANSTTNAEKKPKKSLRGRIGATIAAAVAAVVLLFGMTTAFALSGTEHGDHNTFAELLPITEVHIDPSKMVGGQMEILDTHFAAEDQYIALTDGLRSGTLYTYGGDIVRWTFADAAILSDRSTADVVITLRDVNIQTGYANATATGNTTTALSGHASVMNINGLAMHVGVETLTSGNLNWRYGLEADVNISVPGVSGDMIYGVVGMTNTRYSATGNAYTRIPGARDHDYYAESTVVRDGSTTTGLYYPAVANGYGANAISEGGDVRIVGGGKNGNAETLLGDDKTWDYSFYSGFVTEANANAGMSTTYRAAGGYNGTSQGINSSLMPPDVARILDISSSPGGQVFINKDGTLGEELGQGLYSVPRGKDVIVKLKPDNKGYYPKVVYAGDWTGFTGHTGDTVQPTRVEQGGEVYYTYTFKGVENGSVAGDSELYVEWAPLPAKVKATKVWEDDHNIFQDRGDIKFTLTPDILPSQKIDYNRDTYDVLWGYESGFTSADNVQIPGSVPDNGNAYYYDNSIYRWVPYTPSTGASEAGVKEDPQVAGGTNVQADFLPKYDASGNVIDYSGVFEENMGSYSVETYYDTAKTTIKEEHKPTSEDGVVDSDNTWQDKNTADYEYKITNTLKKEPFAITKAWNDENNAAGKRPSAEQFASMLSFYWKTAGSEVPDWATPIGGLENNLAVTDNGDGTFTASWANLPQYYKYEKTSYAAEETTVPTGYKLETTGKVTDGGTITNTYKKDVEITKKWTDEDNKYENRPSTDDMVGAFTLYTDEQASIAAPGAPTPTVTDNGNGTFTVKWEGVAKYDAGGNEITYYARETTVPSHYNVVGSAVAVEATGVVENEVEKIDLTITKTWANDTEYLGAHPTGANEYERKTVPITITGTAGGETVPLPDNLKNVQLTSADVASGTTWQKKFEGYPKYYKGNEITYTMEEQVPDGFQKSENESLDMTTQTGGVANEPVKREEHDGITLTIKKTDALTNTGAGLEGATFEITKEDGSAVDGAAALTTGADGTVTFEFTEPGTYKVKETAAPTGYVLDSASEHTIVVGENLTSITLVDNPDAATSGIAKVWEWLYNLFFGAGSTPASTATFTNGTLTVTDQPKTAKVKVTKEWDDNDDQDGYRRDATAQLQKKVGAGDWTRVSGRDAGDIETTYTTRTDVIEWADLPAYEDGQPVTYRVVEMRGGTPGIDRYETTYAMDGGTAVAYENYVGGNLLTDPDTTTDRTFDITNTHEPEKTTLTINKVWNDASHVAGTAQNNAGDTVPAETNNYTRPSKLEFQITGTVDDTPVTLPEGKDSAAIEPTDVADNTQWTTTVTDLPVFDNGTRIRYDVTETTPDGYAQSRTQAPTRADDGTWSVEYTNTPIDEEILNPTSIILKKIDGDARGGGVLGGAVFTVTAPDGTTSEYTTASATDTETGDVKGQVTIDFNQPGDWKIAEKTPPTGYIKNDSTFTVTVDKDLKTIQIKPDKSAWQWIWDLFVDEATGTWDDAQKTLTVPNQPQKTNLTVNKQWHDNTNQDRQRIRQLGFELSENGAVSERSDAQKNMNQNSRYATIPDDVTTGTITWTDLPMYRNGEPIAYSVRERAATLAQIPEYTDTYAGYNTDVDGNGENDGLVLSSAAADNVITATNTHEPQTIAIRVVKDWDDEDASRRGIGNLSLYQKTDNGETVLSNRVGRVTKDTEDGATVVVWEGLPVYDNGKAITYRVEETQVAHYAEPAYAVEYTVVAGVPNAEEADSFNAGDVKRPAAGDTDEPVVTMTVTNTALIDIPVKKIWVDGAVANVNYQLYRTTVAEADLEGDEALHEETSSFDDTATVNTWAPGSHWEAVEGATHNFTADAFDSSADPDEATFTFTDLPKYDADGNEYRYRVLETTPGGDRFEANQTGDLEVTNTNKYTSAGKVNVNVVKELAGRNWKDDDKFHFQIVPVSGRNVDTGEAIAVADVPLPTDPNTGEAKTVADADTSNTAVGALGYAVNFEPILYASDATTAGHTFEYYYDIYEVADADGTPLPAQTIDGVTYTGEMDGDTFKPTVHKLRVVAVDQGNGAITATPYWDGKTDLSAVPVYTNTYDATVKGFGYVVKKIDGRDYASGDSFDFKWTNLAGSIFREAEGAEASTEPHLRDAVTISSENGQVVEADGAHYDATAAATGDTKAAATTGATWIKASDLPLPAEGKAKGTFIYELVEDASASEAAGDDLIFDPKRVYAKLELEDNQDGTMSAGVTYWLDAACTIPAPEAKVLIDTATGELAPAGSAEGGRYAYVNAAFFENEKVSDITVKKTWVNEAGEPIEPTDNAQVRLNRYKVADAENPGELPTNPDEWEPVANHTFDRGDFYTATIDGVEYTQTAAARALGNGEITAEQFEAADWAFDPEAPSYTFTDLPLHVKDADGNDWQYVYRVREATGSGAFTTQYKTDVANEWVDSWTGIHNARDHTITIKNTPVATNTVNIAAVKQLLGREWLSADADGAEVDRYDFELVPVGIGTYDADGKLQASELEAVEHGYQGVKTIAASQLKDGGAATPNMPASHVSTELGDASNHDVDNLARAAKVTESGDDANGTEEAVGVGERLARFGEIEYTMDDLVYDPGNGHMQGDFFYLMKERIPAGATANDDGTYTLAGVTYDTTVHTVHVKVRENATNKLVVQLAYDETTPGDISTGTQFTPVYTNRYAATNVATPFVDKHVMGRGWKAGETFDFSMTPLSGAPFADADASEFPEQGTMNDADREAALAGGKAVHSAEGAHVVRMSVPAGADGTNEALRIQFPKIRFTEDDLHNEAPAEGVDAEGKALAYSNGTPVPAGTKYGRFMYAFEELKASEADLAVDTDTEYVQVTIIDKGNGELDLQVAIFEDRYASVPRYAPNADGTASATPADAAVFVNQLTRTLDVTKAWAAPATSDVTLKLQWSTDGSTWVDAAGTEWLAGVEPTKTIGQHATGEELTVRWENLPAYAADGDDLDLNDAWVTYRVVEQPIEHVDTRYSMDAWAEGDTKDAAKYSAEPLTTGPEKDPTGAWVTNRVTALHVANFPQDLEGTATVHVVKQLIGRGWMNSDAFDFVIVPKESKIGAETSATPAAERAMPMPAAGGNPSTAATATQAGSIPVSVNEYNATFDPITIKLSDLALDPADNIAKGTFTYTVAEKRPEGAIEYTDPAGVTYWVKDNVKYTTETHEIVVTAMNDGSGEVATTVSWDGRPVGDFVPVYTNEALLPTPVAGTKTWIGGEEAEHVNANAAGADQLGVTIYRKTVADSETALTVDDAGRPLRVVWDAATGNATYTIKAVAAADDGEGNVTETLVDPVLDTVGPKGNEYAYRIAETAVPATYAATSAGENVAGKDITNTSTKTDSIKVTKAWDDADDAEGLRPAKVVMHLYKQVAGSEVQVEVAKQEIANGSEAAGATWTDLPVYDAAGNKITYVVIEEAEYGYTTTYKTVEATEYTAAGNSLQLDGDAEQAAQVIDVKNSLTPATDKVTVTKVWDDNENHDGKRPTSIVIQLFEYTWNTTSSKYVKNETAVATITLDGAADDAATGETIKTQETAAWTGEFTDLPATKNGKTVLYEVDETTVPDGYTKGCISGNQVDGFTVKNIHETEKTTFTGTKVWLDTGKVHDNVAEIDPYIEVYRSADNGQTWSEKLTSGTDYKIEWQPAQNERHPFVITGLDKYNPNGAAYLYRVKEDDINNRRPGAPINMGYSTTYVNTDSHATDTNYLYDGGTIYNAQSITIGVGKMWVDGDNALNTRKATTITLEKSLDYDTTWETVGTPDYGTTDVPTDRDVANIALWSNQPAYARNASGELVRVNYRLTENVDGLDGYTTSYLVEDVGNWDGNVSDFDVSSCTEQPATGLTRMTTFVNTYDVKDSITVTKTWDDANDAEGLRPDEVVLHLYREPSVVLTEAELLALQQQAYNSVNPHDYDTDGSGAVDTMEEYNAYMVGIQTKYQELVDAEIAARKAAAEPLQVEVEKKTIKKNDDGTWTTATWSDLPLFDAENQLITYIVEEESVAGYTTTYSVDNKTTYAADKNKLTLDGVTGAQNVDVKNSLTPATEKVAVAKVWNDDNNADGKRPENVKVDLFEYVWTETETSSKYEKSANPVATITLNGTADDAAAGTTIKTQETAAWTGEFTNLPATKNGKTVIYESAEQTTDTNVFADPGTEGKYSNEPCIAGNQLEGFTVTNSYTRETTMATITKVWADNYDAFGNRPATLTMELWRAYKGADDKAVYEKVTSDVNGYAIKHMMSADDADASDTSGNTWKLEYSNLPKNTAVDTADGTVSRAYTYYWKETEPTGYKATTPSDADPTAGFSPKEDTDAFTISSGDTVTNTQFTGTLTVTKTWDDADDQDGLRTAAITAFKNNLKLYADGQEVDIPETPTTGSVTKRVTDASGTTPLTVVYENLPVMRGDGSEITYSVDEGAIAGYNLQAGVTTSDTLEVEIGETEATGTIALVNEHTPGVTNFIGTKVWVDGGKDHDNADELASSLTLWSTTTVPEDWDTGEVEVEWTKVGTLDSDNLYVEWSTTATANDTFTITNLPMYVTEDGETNALYYSVTEEAPEGYTVSYWEADADADNDKGIQTGGTIINTIEQEYIQIPVTKVWADNSNQDGIRTTSLKLFLYRNNELVATGTIADATAADSQTYTFDASNASADKTGDEGGFKKYAEDGSEYIYTVREDPGVRSDYQVSYTDASGAPLGPTATGAPAGGTITNSYNPDTTSITATKVWIDADNQDNMRGSVQFELRANGVKVEKDADDVDLTNPVTVATGDDFDEELTATWTNLPVYANGTEIDYTVVETNTPVGYIATTTGNKDTGFTITNNHGAHTRVITATKVWDDAYYVGKTGYERPKDVSVNLFADGVAVGENRGLSEDNNWTTSWTVPTSDDGQAIEYVVKEINTPSGYTYSGDVTVDNNGQNATVTLTNTPNQEEAINQVDLIVYKTDDLSEPLAGATFALTAPDGTPVGNYTSDATGKLTLPLTTTGNYKLKETSAPAGYTADDTEYTINVDKELRKVRLSIDGSVFQWIYDLIFGATQPDNFDDATNTLTVVNTAKTYKLTVSKTFEGLTEAEIPANFTVTASIYDESLPGGFKDVSLTTTDESVTETTDAQAGTITYTWIVEDIRHGSEIFLSESGYRVTGYDVAAGLPLAIYMATADTTHTFTNTYTPKTTDVTITKVWDDAGDQDGIRPILADVADIFTLKANGADVADAEAEIVEAEGDTWVVTWSDLPTHNNGTEITYTVEETSIDGYTADATSASDGGTITNTHEPTTDSLTTTVSWDDADNAEGTRPDKVVLHLYKMVDGTPVQVEVEKKEVSKGDEATGVTWDNLPVYENGQKIDYFVVQEAVAGYTTTYCIDIDEGLYFDEANETVQLDGEPGAQLIDVNNSLTPATTEVTATKVWNDNNNAYGKRPESIQVKLYQRVWNETNSAYGDEVEATYADGQLIPTVTLDGTADEGNAPVKETGEWTVTFGDLPATMNGKTVLYSVKEITTDEAVFADNGNPGTYSNTPCITGDQVDGFTIKNIYTPESHTITITKTFWEYYYGYALPDWAIENDIAELFPFQIKVHYTERAADGTVQVKDAVLTLADATHEDNSGVYTWTIDNVASGTEVNVSEMHQDLMDGYNFFFAQMKQGDGEYTDDSSMENINFTMPGEDTNVDILNNYNLDEGFIIPIKVWDDENNLDGLRPEKVTFTLTAFRTGRLSRPTSEPANVFTDGEGNPTNVFEFDVMPGNDGVNSNQWSKVDRAARNVIDNLPVVHEGNTVSYKLEEKDVPYGYTVTVDDSSLFQGTFTDYGGRIVVTNTHEVDATTATITKVWDDIDTVRYVANDGSGYAVSAPEYEELPDTGDDQNYGKNDFTREVTHSVLRPDTLSMELWRTYLGADEQPVYELVQPVTLSYNNEVGENTWKATVENLPTHLLLTVGEDDEVQQVSREITYYWKETVPESYTATVTGEDPAPGDAAKTTDAGEAPVAKAANGETITNKLEAFLLYVNKTWADGDNREGMRSPDVYVRLYATTDDSMSGDANWTSIGHASVNFNDGKDGFTGARRWYSGDPDSYFVPLAEDGFGYLVLPAYKDGKLISYLLAEDDLSEDGYTTTYRISGKDETVEDQILFTYNDRDTYASGEISDTVVVRINNRRDPGFSVTKVWNDNDNVLGKRPSADEFKSSLRLFANTFEFGDEDLVIKETTDVTEQYADKLNVVDNGDGTYTATWTELPQWENGVSQTILLTDRIAYHVVEDQVEGYVAPTYANKDNNHTDIDEGAATDRAYDRGTITNALTTELIDIPVTKVWNDNNNEESLRPNSVNVVLYADGTPVATKTITTPANDQTEATVTFEGMRKYRDGSREEIAYTVKEEAVPGGYTATITGNQRDGLIITNTHAKEMIPVYLVKAWNDAELLGTEGYQRPDKVTIRVTGTDEAGNKLYERDFALTSEDGEEGSSVWMRELELPVNIGGSQVYYIGEELDVEGYLRDLNSSHVFEPYVSVMAVNKPDMREQTDTLSFTVAKIDSKTGKALEGAEFKLVSPNGTETVETTSADGKASFTLDETGTYTLIETAAPANHKLGDTYSWTIQTAQDNDNITITKLTEGEGDEQTSFWNKLFGMVFSGTPEGFNAQTATLTVENPPVDTKTISYVDPENEDSSKRIVLSETIKSGDNEPAQPADPTRDGYKFVGWNKTVDPATGDETYTATWEKIPDEPEPEQITITYIDPSKPEGEQTVLLETINRGDDEPAQPANPEREGFRFTGWDRTTDPETGNVVYTATWEEIPEPEPIAITYLDESKPEGEQTIQQDTINRGDNEPAQPQDPTRDGFTFGGWQRSQNADGSVVYKARWIENPTPPDPGKITVTYKDSDKTVIAEMITRGDDEPAQPEDPSQEGKIFTGWKRTTDPETGNVTYEATYIDAPEPCPERTSIIAKKVWSDGDNADGVRPDHVTVRLLANGNVYRTAALTVEGEWTYVFEGLPKYLAGTQDLISYTVEEAVMADYTPAYTGEGTADSPLIVTNTRTPATPLTLKATKIWAAEDGDTSARKDVVFHLVKVVDGYGPVRVDGQDKTIPAAAEGDALTVTWTNLPAMEAGKKVTYTVEEEGVPGYSVNLDDGTVEDNTISIVVTNTKDVVIPDPDPETIVITYTDGQGNVLQTETIVRGTDETPAPADPVREGYKFVGWDRVTNPETGDVSYTAQWEEVPGPQQITIKYLDPENEDETKREVINETINRGDDEPAQPADPTREGYTFVGWERITDAEGNVTYAAKWEKVPDPAKITVSYVDGQGNTIQTDEIVRGDNEPAAPEAPTRIGFSFTGWERTVDPETGNVTYTATWAEVPGLTPKVSYVDPKAEDGKMILAAKKYDGQDAADTEASAKADAPTDPTHEGYTFVGWVVNQDEFGDYVLVAKYNETTPEPQRTVTYIDSHAKDILVKTEATDDPTTVETPSTPKHDGLRFIGWEQTQDAAGNIIYAATYELETVTPPTRWVRYIDPATDRIIMVETPLDAEGNEPPTPTSPTRPGYNFDGWDRSVDKDGNITYTAKWKALTPEQPATPTPTTQTVTQSTPTVTYTSPGVATGTTTTIARVAVPQTGDATNYALVAGLALIGVLFATLSLWLRRSHSRHD